MTFTIDELRIIAQRNSKYKLITKDLAREVLQLRDDIDKFWFMVKHGWDIENREYFEREARINGFDSPLAQAAHHMWKRRIKEDAEFK